MTLRVVKKLSQFPQELAIMDKALANGGGEVTFPDHGKAVRFRQSLYQFRKLFRDTQPGMSPYDRLTIDTIPTGGTTVVIRPLAFDGVFTPRNGGTPITVETAPVEEEEDELLKLALQVRRKLDV